MSEKTNESTRMKLLLLCDDKYHPGEIPIQGTKPLLDKGCTIDVVTDTSDFDPASMFAYDVVILSKSDHISSTNHAPWKTLAFQKAMVQYVEGGGGLFVIHSGLVGGEDTELLDRLIGSRFIKHPPLDTVSTFGMPMGGEQHPVVKHFYASRAQDELYILEFLQTDYTETLISSRMRDAGDRLEAIDKYVTTGYVRTQGKGRILAVAQGHTLEAWLCDRYQTLLIHGAEWCAGLL